MASSKSNSPDRGVDREERKDDRNGGRRDSRSRSGSGRRNHGRDNSSENTNQGNVLYVGGLQRRVTENDIRGLFEPIGKVNDIEIVKDPSSNDCRGYAFVKFVSPQDASEAVERFHKKEFQGRTLQVEKSKRNQGHAKTPGQYLGHNNRRRDRRSRSPHRHRRDRSRSGRRHSRERRNSRDRYSRERHSDRHGSREKRYRRDRDHRDHRDHRDRSRSGGRYRDRSDSRPRRR